LHGYSKRVTQEALEFCSVPGFQFGNRLCLGLALVSYCIEDIQHRRPIVYSSGFYPAQSRRKGNREGKAKAVI